MKKNILLPSIFLILIALMVWMYFQNLSKSKDKAALESQIQQLPDFEFKDLIQQASFNQKGIESGKNTLLLYFHSECEHCQYEINEIIQHAERLKNTMVLLVSSEEEAVLKTLIDQYELGNYPFIRLLKAEAEIFYKTFGTTATPSLLIYDGEGRLSKKFKGEVKIEAIIKYLPHGN